MPLIHTARRAALFAAAACVLFSLGLAAPTGSAQGLLPSGFVTDTAGLLSGDERTRLEQRLAALDDSSSVQIAVVTVPRLDGEAVASAALALFQAWGVGQREVNNGLLVLVSQLDRKVYVSTGLGLEWQVPDSTASVAVAEMLPWFRTGAFGEGLSAGVEFLAARAAAVP